MLKIILVSVSDSLEIPIPDNLNTERALLYLIPLYTVFEFCSFTSHPITSLLQPTKETNPHLFYLNKAREVLIKIWLYSS